MAVNSFKMPPFTWFMGEVEDNSTDPEKLGRVKCRIFGYHTADDEKIKTEHLYWAQVMSDINSASFSGLGNSPTGMLKGTHVFGFFSDGEQAQMPVIMGTLNGKVPDQKKSKYKGKKELYDDNESDMNRLVRNDKIDKTIVKKKRDNLVEFTGVKGKQHKERKTEYDAKYPYNQVMESEAGHIVEFDNTPDKERIHEYHTKGTFYEIYPDGSKVTKIVKDNYSLILGDDYCYVKGTCHITVDGDAMVKVKGNAITEIDGDKTEDIKGNYKLNVTGDYDVNVKGSQNSTTSGLEKRKAQIIMLN